MRVYIFPYVEQLTERYHPGGGLVAIAEDEDGIRAMIAADTDIQLTDDEWAEATWFTIIDDAVAPQYWVFPDAGCC